MSLKIRIILLGIHYPGVNYAIRLLNFKEVLRILLLEENSIHQFKFFPNLPNRSSKNIIVRASMTSLESNSSSYLT